MISPRNLVQYNKKNVKAKKKKYNKKSKKKDNYQSHNLYSYEYEDLHYYYDNISTTSQIMEIAKEVFGTSARYWSVGDNIEVR